jgi:hypothetical protein
MLQTAIINNPAQALYDRIFSEHRPAERLKLITEFESKYATGGSKLANAQMKGQVFGFATDIYQQQNNGAKVIEYGEKTLQNDPENLHVLVLLARQYSLTSDGAGHAADYAKRAIALIPKLRSGPVAPGFTKQTWDQYLNTNQSSAQGTLEYLRAATQRFAQTGRRP